MQEQPEPLIRPRSFMAGLLAILMLSLSCLSTLCALRCEFARSGSMCSHDGRDSDRASRNMDHCGMTSKDAGAAHAALAEMQGCRHACTIESLANQLNSPRFRLLIAVNGTVAGWPPFLALWTDDSPTRRSSGNSSGQGSGSVYSVLRV